MLVSKSSLVSSENSFTIQPAKNNKILIYLPIQCIEKFHHFYRQLVLGALEVQDIWSKSMIKDIVLHLPSFFGGLAVLVASAIVLVT